MRGGMRDGDGLGIEIFVLYLLGGLLAEKNRDGIRSQML